MVFLYNGYFGCLPRRGASKTAPNSEYYRNPTTVHPTHHKSNTNPKSSNTIQIRNT
jgi:hypothetical protein